MARTSERLGFFDLPREIRDEIYRLCFSKKYTLPDNGGGLGSSDVMMLIKRPNLRGPSKSHILQISQRMRFEAEQILFTESIFCLRLSESDRQSLSRELADRFMNLCIYISARVFTHRTRDYDHRVLRMFGGSRVRGKICTVNFSPGLWVPDTCLFNVLKTFTGFETVRIQLSKAIPFGQRETWRINCFIRENLEYALGDAMAFEDSNTRGLEFHPQDRASAHISGASTASTDTL